MPDRRLLPALLVALGLLFAAGCSAAPDEPNLPADVEIVDDDGFNGAGLAEPYQVPEVTLRDTAGASYTLGREPGAELTLVFFGYTNCPDACQIAMATLASALTRLDAADRERVAVVLVTTDPARDDEATLRRYLDRFNPDFIGLTGELSDITRLAEPLGVAIERGRKLPSGGYEVDHGTPIIAVEAGGTAPVLWTEGTSSADLAADVAKLLS